MLGTQNAAPTPHNSRRTTSPTPSAFTLIELLVVISIIAVLIAILLPQLAHARMRARTAVCAANLHSLGIGVNTYLDEYNGSFFRYYVNTPASSPLGKGRLWWFGFEPNGPGTTANRPLDKSASPLAPYTANLDVRMQCPEFPYDDPLFFPKFNQHAASYGFNWNLGPPNLAQPATRQKYLGQTASILLFADAVQFDSPKTFNEGHYITYTNPLTLSGFAHFRHSPGSSGKAQYLLLDGHVDSETLQGPNFRTVAASPTGNLTGEWGPAHLYGVSP